MNLSDLHRRLLADVLAIGTPYPLVITGGYAVQAHGLVNRLSQDLDVATENPAPMADITRDLEHGLTERGWTVTVISADPLSARLVAADAATGEECEIDILKENLWAPPAHTEYGPVLALDDVIGTKVRALADRGAVRDLIDVHAAARHRTTSELEQLGERHGRGEFTLQDLYDRLTGTEWYDDEEFTAYGLTDQQTADLRTWAQHWAGDLEQRLGAGEDGCDT
ncbi:nucleotidyl transferase AbiEii/AbiGii toxin family protein [Streptomyces sp. HNM0663]|uniref:Nucleotidyl transferase AbiEii/AbiGii toxin family protein n=1 Tax=Streptomyces chengmaiensis TaxID=3040919 RepID=A0ABT6HZZ6_9ACTN|nr:nucleotidyl transferase AbiEii/AbiGii toxin family protein [Streptomyces chengmaiensis]MDH2393873.1 nucleotidyl transferase AbiEii/AbiGii toxin family protein [Streptomyces chengmaiensis]